MKKYIFLICTIVIILVLGIVFLKNNNHQLDYQLEQVNEINYLLISENNKFGVINKQGDVIVSPIYDEIDIPNPSKPIFICMYNYNQEKQQYSIKVLNDKSQQILYQYVVVEAIPITPINNDIPYEKSVLKYMENGKYGLIDLEGKKITKAKYEEISALDYVEGLLLVKNKGKYGVITIKGDTVVKTKYDLIQSDGFFTEKDSFKKSGFIVANKENDNYKYGYINYKGKVVLKNKYNQIARIPSNSDDIYLVAFEDEKAGFYINNKNVIKHEFEDIEYDANNNCLVLQKDSKQGLADFKGNAVLNIEYDNLYISGKYVNCLKDGKMEIYNYETNEKLNYENIVGINKTDNPNYSIAITSDEKYKILNNENNELIEDEYDYLELLYDNLFIAYKNNKYGVIDENLNTIINFKYDYIQKINGTKLIEAYNEKSDITDYIFENNIVISMKNANAVICDNYIKVNSNNDFKYIDFQGNILENIDALKSEFIPKQQKGKWGYTDNEGNFIINPVYEMVTEFNKYGFAGIKQNGKWGSINSKGEIVVEPEYTIDSNEPNFIGKYYEFNLGYGKPYYICENID